MLFFRRANYFIRKIVNDFFSGREKRTANETLGRCHGLPGVLSIQDSAMIPPEKIVGRNKKRDAEICNLWAGDKKSTKEISEQFSITQRRVQIVLENNQSSLSVDAAWELTKDIHRLDQEIGRQPFSKKDVVDIIALKHYLLGNGKPLIDNSQHTHFTVHHLSKEFNERKNKIESHVPTTLKDRLLEAKSDAINRQSGSESIST